MYNVIRVVSNNDLAIKLDTSAHRSRDADCVVWVTCCDEAAALYTLVLTTQILNF